MSRLLGIVLLAVGIVLLGFGMNASHSVTEKVVEGVSGRYTNDTMWYIVSGIAMIVGGGALALIGKPRE